ncbi:hypothetical protein QFZ66_005983 [Streptomyces sp. B4I13]|nr:hypothetical protein [Streptomyces sp. B4I13]
MGPFPQVRSLHKWGGWDSNPRPTDYESFEDLGGPCVSTPIHAVLAGQLGEAGSALTRLCQPVPVLVSPRRPQQVPRGGGQVLCGHHASMRTGLELMRNGFSLPASNGSTPARGLAYPPSGSDIATAVSEPPVPTPAAPSASPLRSVVHVLESSGGRAALQPDDGERSHSVPVFASHPGRGIGPRSLWLPADERRPLRRGTWLLALATRYDKTPESYLAGLHLRAATIWISSLLKPIDHN